MDTKSQPTRLDSNPIMDYFWSENYDRFYIPIKPVSAPRMSSSSRWIGGKIKQLEKYNFLWNRGDRSQAVKKKRMEYLQAKKVQDYFKYKNDIKMICSRLFKRESLGSQMIVEFRIPVTDSWSNKKKKDHINQPHHKRPDWDNLAKGLQDSIYKEDSHVSVGVINKIWTEPIDSGIIIFISRK